MRTATKEKIGNEWWTNIYGIFGMERGRFQSIAIVLRASNNVINKYLTGSLWTKGKTSLYNLFIYLVSAYL